MKRQKRVCRPRLTAFLSYSRKKQKKKDRFDGKQCVWKASVQSVVFVKFVACISFALERSVSRGSPSRRNEFQDARRGFAYECFGAVYTVPRQAGIVSGIRCFSRTWTMRPREHAPFLPFNSEKYNGPEFPRARLCSFTVFLPAHAHTQTRIHIRKSTWNFAAGLTESQRA